ncbi:Ca-activated chloride channel family protein [Mucilaginibacter sp. OK268]|uniref:vWA domain-containing protein n=1 Tax=Mucilaginibacter sp. OK268 TaxID=1881048 RepID=UPI000890375A|nr:VWA domain-containing protein [Mucilaginibacter sp. OK268]SDP87001.1 Ca-activated chloride channel family protein [Mucilaginibacter sp. OK268]
MKQLLFILIFAGLTGFKPATNRHISGTVYDDNSQALPGAQVIITGGHQGTQTDIKGHYTIDVPEGKNTLTFSFIGFEPQTIKISKSNTLDVHLKASNKSLNEVVVVGYGVQHKKDVTGAVTSINSAAADKMYSAPIAGVVAGKSKRYSNKSVQMSSIQMMPSPPENTESYKGINENGFKTVTSEPLSTFSVDVDAASYSNVRRFINNGQLPPADAVRIEEMINYFHYNLVGPTNNEPVAIHTELSAAPWNSNHRLLRIGLKAKTIANDKLPASNLVFLIDVSGSMYEPNKLPLVQSSLKMLVNQLRPQDKVAIVVYAGAAGVVLPATSGDKKTTISNAIDNLQAGGSTAGGAGIKLAYKIAMENFMKGGNNRVMLATDGDFNVGASSDDDMEKLIEKERESGISLSVLGFGMGNYKDSKMETLADKGNGNYAYIDNITEARKTLISEFGGTLFTIAKDVKLQVEFNPGKVQAYRLLGYENRALNKEDFNNDKKDAGDMGSGHTVTAFYEIVPAGVKDDYSSSVDPLKYQKPKPVPYTSSSDEMLTIKFRYKQPTSSVSKMSHVEVYDKPVVLNSTSTDFRFAAAVAEFGMLLRDSQFKQHSTYDQAIKMARTAKGDDSEGYRAEFIKLAESAKLLNPNKALAADEER